MDHLNFVAILERDLALWILNRIHPCNFFIGNGSMEIKARINIPRQNIIGINNWLADDE
jgi:hypothetical protein